MHDQFYPQPTEPFKLEEYFQGSCFAWGIFEDCLGKLRRSFQVQIEGTIENGVLILDEQFLYNDGQREQRIWRITPAGSARYRGRADDLRGEARGHVQGQRLHWRYQMDLPVGGRKIRVCFDDQLYLQPGGVLINRAQVRKLGIPLGSVTLFFQRRQAAA